MSLSPKSYLSRTADKVLTVLKHSGYMVGLYTSEKSLGLTQDRFHQEMAAIIHGQAEELLDLSCFFTSTLDKDDSYESIEYGFWSHYGEEAHIGRLTKTITLKHGTNQQQTFGPVISREMADAFIPILNEMANRKKAA